MDINNRLCLIWGGLAYNAYNTYVATEDLSVFTRRTNAEGAEFYARTMSALRSDLLRGLSTGKFECTARFKCKTDSTLPAFLYNAWSQVFTDEGLTRDDIDVGAVDCLSQLTAVFSKVKGGHTPESEVKLVDNFIRNEENLFSSRIDLTRLIAGRIPLGNILKSASETLSKVLGAVNPREISPRHSAGVSSCGTPLWRRYKLPPYIAKLHTYWDYTEYCTLGATHVADKLYSTLCIPEGETRAKVLIVPKNAKTGRLISCEPAPHMYVQQGLKALLCDRAPRHNLTRSSVYFTDQRPNQRAARLGSQNYQFDSPDNLASLDLSDASDLIRLDLVQYLFPCEWGEALTRCRTEQTVLPDGRVLTLSKHAPMGSATCFPVMAYVIWSLLNAAIPQHIDGRKTTILVYGDDIIVPARYAERAMEVLEAVHLKVNRDKSFYRGPFRESCGKEYVKGTDVTPVYLRKLPHDGLDSRDALISFANNLFDKFGEEQQWLVERLDRHYGRLPRVAYDQSHRVRASYNPDIWVDDWQQSRMRRDPTYQPTISGVLWSWTPDNRGLQRRPCKIDPYRAEYKILVAVPVKVKYPKHDWSQVFRALVNPRREPALGIDAVANRVSYKWVWTAL